MKIACIPALIIMSILLTACGTSPTKPATKTPASPPPTTGGGYYLDDGPGEISLAELERIPDAVPRAENIRSANSRPYTALGQRYTPMTSYRPYKQRGIASWYGKRYHGNQTASGEPYDMYAMTAAHTTLPIPSYARVTNPENGRTVIVRINDRGPFLQERLIDLSYVAAYKLGIVQQGSGLVDVEWIDTRPGALNSPSATSTNVDTGISPDIGLYVQVGAFQSRENAERLREDLQNRRLAITPAGEIIPVQSWYNNGTYRVRLGPYSSRLEADRAATSINQSMGTNAIIVFQN